MAVSMSYALLCSCAKFQAYSIGLIPSVSVTGSNVVGAAPTNSGMHLGLGMAAGAAACLSAGVQQVVLLPHFRFIHPTTIHHCMLPVQKLLITVFFRNCCTASRHWLLIFLLHLPQLWGSVIVS